MAGKGRKVSARPSRTISRRQKPLQWHMKQTQTQCNKKKG
jgi:hypothetical protein